MYRKYHGFLHFFASRGQSKPTKNTGIYSVLTRQHAKIDTFSAHAPPFKKRMFFTFFVATAHPDSRRR